VTTVHPSPPAAEADPFWEALERGVLLIIRCDSCDRAALPLTRSCPHCGSPDVHPEEAGGGGSVYSWVTVHVPLDPAFAADVPYTILAVTLDEDVRVFGRLTGASPAAIVAGLQVELAPLQVHGRTVPAFCPSPGPPSIAVSA